MTEQSAREEQYRLTVTVRVTVDGACCKVVEDWNTDENVQSWHGPISFDAVDQLVRATAFAQQDAVALLEEREPF